VKTYGSKPHQGADIPDEALSDSHEFKDKTANGANEGQQADSFSAHGRPEYHSGGA
jgi:hypothetical protein